MKALRSAARRGALACRWSSTAAGRPKTAIFFPGQGVQRVGMLTPWIEAFPATSARLLDEIDHHMGYRLSEVIRSGPSARLTQTTVAQPAIMATSVFILRVLEREFGLRAADRFDFALGHSLGEFSALVAGGYMAFQDGLHLVRRRAEAMAEAVRRAAIDRGGAAYGMVAVITEPEYLPGLVAAIRGFVGHHHHAPGEDSGGGGGDGEDRPAQPPIEHVSIANVNSRNQIVLSGDLERIRTLIAHVRQFLGHDPRAVLLRGDCPFHSPVMRPAAAATLALLSGKSRVPGREADDVVAFPGRMPCVSNVTARPFASRDDLRQLVARGCLETVRWWDSIRYLDQEERVRRWVGIGPGKVGRNLVGKEVGMRGRDRVKGGGVWALTDPDEVEEVLRALEETDGALEDDEGEGSSDEVPYDGGGGRRRHGMMPTWVS
ncbi:Malonyl CoA-acyl carrier protein transacylase [Escovopsis weberi]|uniref:[acyl-carrier-protein] S-malonyltransferase n=1 Tax=Escovopsis weberi TaxID=150374 RepID=A0A0M8MWQ8_ESCWE|nr:Malonyl CoA-acyl carrier protein transacylase [Escovopsis weberi]